MTSVQWGSSTALSSVSTGDGASRAGVSMWCLRMPLIGHRRQGAVLWLVWVAELPTIALQFFVPRRVHVEHVCPDIFVMFCRLTQTEFCVTFLSWVKLHFSGRLSSVRTEDLICNWSRRKCCCCYVGVAWNVGSDLIVRRFSGLMSRFYVAKLILNEQ